MIFKIYTEPISNWMYFNEWPLLLSSASLCEKRNSVALITKYAFLLKSFFKNTMIAEIEDGTSKRDDLNFTWCIEMCCFEYLLGSVTKIVSPGNHTYFYTRLDTNSNPVSQIGRLLNVDIWSKILWLD